MWYPISTGGIAALNPRLISNSPAGLTRSRSGFRQKAAILPSHACGEVGGGLPTRRYAQSGCGKPVRRPGGPMDISRGQRPRIRRRSEMRPGRGEGNPRHDSGTLPGCRAKAVGFRGYRCAQPPANIRQPCRADEAWCLRAAFCRHAATRGAGAQARRAGIFVETPSIWPQAPSGAKWLPGIAA